jgi:hypothetical protein
MQKKDVEIVEEDLVCSEASPYVLECFGRIKTALAESEKTPTNSKSMPCCSCCEHAGYPIDLKVCPECDRVIE